MANSSITLTSLDFDTLKQNLKNYLSSQSTFKDYNFDGSNINVLLDVMSYNTYLNSFYLNMVASEMFLDTAQKLDTVVSHAKELNYTPRSYKSSTANVNISFTATGIKLPFSIPKGTIFNGTNSNGTYSFATNELYSYNSANSTYNITDLQLYEGKYLTDSYIMNYNDETQKFVLSNKNIDLSSLLITVYENNKQNVTNFTRVNTLFRLDNYSNVFFIQSAQNEQYEILFGDGILGRKPINESLIVASYRIVNGSDADGISSFTINTDLAGFNSGIVSVTNITVGSNSTGGANSEDIESIRFSAPRYFAAQQRAVASDDYSSIILDKFGGQIDDISVYGGETLEPKQYGRVIISVKALGLTIAPDYLKNSISNYMTDYVSIPTRVIVTDPQYLYCGIKTTVQYDKNLTTKTASEISSIVYNTILTFSKNNLEKFGKDFRYSKLVAYIDNSDTSITSNHTDIKIIKKITPLINYHSSFSIDFNNPAYYPGIDSNYLKIYGNSIDATLLSSVFTYVSDSGTLYPLSYIQDDNLGNLIVFSYVNQIFTITNPNIGSIDYTTGKVQINNLLVSNYNNFISLYLNVRNQDAIVNKDKILIIDSNDINIIIQDTAR